MANDYINQVKLTDGTVVDIKDTVSGYITSASVPSASSTTPKMDGAAAVGTETAFARGDHIHPTDTSRASLDIVAPEWEPNVDYWEWDSVIYQGQLYFCNEGHVSSSTWDSSKWTPITVGGLAYTMMSEKIDDPSTKTSGQFLKYNGTTWVAGDVPEGSAASSTTPKMDGTASTGSENAFARGDHIHPTDTSRQAKITASGILKGNGSGTVIAATAGTDYQAPLVSGTNIKTINNESILGSGNISISGGGALILPYNSADVGGESIEDLIQEALSSDTPVFVAIAPSYFNNEHGALLPLVYYNISTHYFEFGGMVDNQSIYTDYEYNDYWGSVSIKTFSNHVSSANTNSKLYLMGATTQVSNPPSMGSNSNVYATNGVLNATSFSINESANIVYNSSSKSIDFTFV